ncbi:high mobility group B protein 9-like isoform X3 [Iris pallida]|uniref:High mobility group B protein 9-like isoform X3 n=1 Tax=Iris pallida TaxID=29817 RepID=A0AAX6FRN0_IRIPA|nr:high mobility group B protein 9-like isoform X3 [Iris pallida]
MFLWANLHSVTETLYNTGLLISFLHHNTHSIHSNLPPYSLLQPVARLLQELLLSAASNATAPLVLWYTGDPSCSQFHLLQTAAINTPKHPHTTTHATAAHSLHPETH